MRPRVDLHFHLLPGVDDGPATMEESVELARAAAADGTGAIVATPHVRHDFLTDVSDLPDRVREVRERLATECVPVRVLCGAELGHEMVGRLTQADLDTVAIGPPGARWVLVETPFEGIGESVHAAAEELRDRGFGVVLAHPERSDAVLADDAIAVRRERSHGTAVQVNATSLTGAHGRAAEAAAVALMRHGRVEALASDAHSLLRGPALERGLSAGGWHGLPAAAIRRVVDFTPVRLVGRGLRPRVTVAA
jgi:protein-tyrosine phosphatase